MSLLSSLSRRIPPTMRSGSGAFAIAFVMAACGQRAPAIVEGAPRKPDGVALDPPLTLPAPRERAQATDGIVSLKTPLGTEAARSVVVRFFTSVVNEDREGLRQLVAPTAIFYNPSSNARENALVYWSRRFDTLDYQLLTGGSLFREDSIELYRADQWDASALSDDSDPSDIIARVRVPPAGTGRPLLGESVTFQLRRVENRFVIQKLTEDFSL